jgi:hypothetical protein
MSGTAVLALTGALAASLLLVAAGVAHLRRPRALAAATAAHGVIDLAVPAAAALGLLETALGAGTAVAAALGARTPLLALLAGQALLLAGFAAYLLHAAGRATTAGRPGLPCGCGLPDLPVGGSAATRAAVPALLSLAGAAWVASPGWSRPAGADAGPLLLIGVAAPTLALLLAVTPSARRPPRTAAVQGAR